MSKHLWAIASFAAFAAIGGADAAEPDLNVKGRDANGGKAELVGEVVGTVAGGVAAGAAAAALGAGPNAINAASSAGSVAGEKLGGAAGAYLDGRAEENKRAGRGGADDPRYDPRSLFGD